MNPPRDRRDRPARRLWIWAGIGYLLLRGWLLLLPGYVYDTLAYKRWALHGAHDGIAHIYRTSDMDYPPLYAYLLTPMAWIYKLLSPEAFQAGHDSVLLTALIKFPPLLFDLAIAGLVIWWVRRGARRAAPPASPGEAHRWGLLLAAAYLLNPVVLFNQGYWGEPDSIHSFFVLAAFLSLFRGEAAKGTAGGPSTEGTAGRMRGKIFPGAAWPAWVLLTLATLMKPLGAPFFPLLLVLSILLHGWIASLLGGIASLLTALLVFSPFIAAGEISQVLHRVIGDVGLMAYTSSNAHNLWWLLGAWRDSEKPWLGPLTPTQIGLGLFGLVYLLLLRRAILWRRERPAGLSASRGLALACGVGFAFFMLSTHMHENHMFVLLPLTLPLIPAGRWWLRFFIAASLGIALNLVLHDLSIPVHWPFTIGGQVSVINRHLHRPFYAVELAAIWASTLFNLGLFAVFLQGVLKRDVRG